MNCTAKHTKYDPTPEEWFCPKCGEKEEFLADFQDTADMDCTRLHDDDWVHCDKCGFETDGKKFSAYWIKKKSLVTCPCCKGIGLVKKEDSE